MKREIIVETDDDFDGCDECIHEDDTMEICKMRGCTHALLDSDIKECYQPKESEGNKMLCEKAYYRNGTGENREKICCSDKRMTDFDGKCPLIYWCPISEKFENTTDMFNCIYRKEKS